jgi:hypothetical protein
MWTILPARAVRVVGLVVLAGLGFFTASARAAEEKAPAAVSQGGEAAAGGPALPTTPAASATPAVPVTSAVPVTPAATPAAGPGYPALPPALPPPPVYADPAVSPSAPPVPPSAPVPAAEPPLRRAPLGGGLTIGWTYTPSNNLPLSTMTNVYTPSGIDLDARFGWQIAGLHGGWPSWVGFMAGFFYYVGDQGISDSLGIDYGIFLKHVLFPGERMRLFIGYGLGAAQVWVKGLGGHGIGHDTRLSAGVEIKLSPKVNLTFEFAYKFIMLSSFAIGTADAASNNFQALNLLAGLWFGR